MLELVWVGIRTTAYAQTFAFFRHVLGLDVHTSQTHVGVLIVPGGATVEVFGPTSPYNEHLTRPVAGFQVSNLEQARADLQAAGAEIVQPVQHGGSRSWTHFRAPDGFVYELVEDPTR